MAWSAVTSWLTVTRSELTTELSSVCERASRSLRYLSRTLGMPAPAARSVKTARQKAAPSAVDRENFRPSQGACNRQMDYLSVTCDLHRRVSLELQHNSANRSAYLQNNGPTLGRKTSDATRQRASGRIVLNMLRAPSMPVMSSMA
jgi:hypothetical protein